jgi:hypothetical protein
MYITPTWKPPRKAPGGQLSAPDNPRGLEAAVALTYISGRTNPGGQRELPLSIAQDEYERLVETYPIFRRGIATRRTSKAFFHMWDDKSIVIGKWDTNSTKNKLNILPVVLRGAHLPSCFSKIPQHTFNTVSHNLFTEDFAFWEPHIDALHTISARFMSHTPPTWMNLNWVDRFTTDAWNKLTRQAGAWIAVQTGEFDKTYLTRVEPRSLSLHGVRAPRKGFKPTISVSGFHSAEVFSEKFVPALQEAQKALHTQITTQPCFQGTNFVKQDAQHKHLTGNEQSRDKGICGEFKPSTTTSHTVIKLAQEFASLMEKTT